MNLRRQRRTDAAGEGGTGDSQSGRRTWPQRLVIAFNIALVMVCLTSAWALAFYSKQLSDIPRVHLPGGLLDQRDDPTKPLNFLLVGADSDEGLAPDDPVRQGRQGQNSSDVIMILRVDPAEQKATLLSLPRDLWVNLPGGRGKGRINTALAMATTPGSPDLLIQTIQDNYHIKINHYLEVNFAAFRGLVEALDGVNLWFDQAARDTHTGLEVDEPGCRVANGVEALAYARSRYYEVRDPSGRWVMDPTYDLGRIARQQYFLKQAAKKAISRGARNPIELNNLLSVAQKYLRIDEGLTPRMILDIVAHFNTFNPDDLQVLQPYVEGANKGGADVLVLQEGPSRPIIDLFRDATTAGGVTEASVRVEVRNGNGRSNQAREIGAALAFRQFVVTKVTDEFGTVGERTVIRHAPGELNVNAAVLVARHLDGEVTFVEDPFLETAEAPVVVITGAALAGVRAQPRPAEDFKDVLDRTAQPASVAPTTPGPGPVAATTTSTTRPPPAAASFVPHPPSDSGC